MLALDSNEVPRLYRLVAYGPDGERIGSATRYLRDDELQTVKAEIGQALTAANIRYSTIDIYPA